LSKSKHHGCRSVRGSAALAAIFFNKGRNSLLEFFKQSNLYINESVLEHLLKKDCKRISRAKQITKQRETKIRRKAMDRQHSITAQNDINDYCAGGFNL
jgi:predicted ribonuclease toxin of YeeF-YezG toxin-antitoxin module